MASNYNVHHSVNELMKHLNVKEDAEQGLRADIVTENLLRSSEHKSKTRESAAAFCRKLEARSDSSFKKTYDELKIQNVAELDPMVHLLARISDDRDIKNMFYIHSKAKERKNKVFPAMMSSKLTDKNHSQSSVLPNNEQPQQYVHYKMNSPNHSNGSLLANKMEVLPVDSNLKLNKNAKAKSKDNLLKDEEENKRNLVRLSLDYNQIDWSNEPEFDPLSKLSVVDQENALIEDLLYILVGIEGKYIRMQIQENEKQKTLIIDRSGDELLYNQANRIVALCPMYSSIIHFVDECNNGMVIQALAAAMRDQIKDYFMLIAQLETEHRKGNLTLQKMWYLLQSCFTNLEILKYFSSSIRKGKINGGAVLTVLHEKTVSLTGNTKAQEFCKIITQKAAEPYFEILEKWIYQGIIDDPYKEFFVEDRNAEIDDERLANLNDLFWETRYTIVRKRIPIFLERYSDKILKTGIYLSVINQCGKTFDFPFDCEPMVYTCEERFYAERIDASYRFTSKELLRLLIEESDLFGRLKSIKHYFFMDQGDYIVQFMDLAGEELEKDINDISPNRLDSLLELALRTSMMNFDPYKDDVRIELLPDSLLTQMYKIINIGHEIDEKDLSDSQSLKGNEALALTFHVPWPLSLILTKRNITCYQMLFRHLFYCKFVERQLEDVWKGNKIAKSFTLNAVTGYAQAFALRQKMLNFVQNLEYYIMVEVIEPNFHHFLETASSKTNSIDEMSQHHQDFIDKCLRDAMLTSSDLLQIVDKLLHLCVSYSEFMKKSQRHADQYELLDSGEHVVTALHGIEEEEYLETHSLRERFEDRINMMHEEFNLSLKHLLEAINENSYEICTSLPDFHYGLDFNKFYSNLLHN